MADTVWPKENKILDVQGENKRLDFNEADIVTEMNEVLQSNQICRKWSSEGSKDFKPCTE